MPADVELELLITDHAEAIRRVESLERAPFESRVADLTEYRRSLLAARVRVRELTVELRVARAEMDDGA